MQDGTGERRPVFRSIFPHGVSFLWEFFRHLRPDRYSCLSSLPPARRPRPSRATSFRPSDLTSRRCDPAPRATSFLLSAPSGGETSPLGRHLSYSPILPALRPRPSGKISPDLLSLLLRTKEHADVHYDILFFVRSSCSLISPFGSETSLLRRHLSSLLSALRPRPSGEILLFL